MSTRVLQAARSAVLAVALAAVIGTTSGQVKPRVKALTPMDYIEIRQLVNRYAFALDTGSNNGYDYADLFAADGEFMRPYAKGREQLAALARGPRRGPDNTEHYIMNHVIEPTADGAIGKAYLIEFNWNIAPAQATGGGAGTGPANGWDLVGRKAGELSRTGGHYEDVYVKTPVGWRFQKRDFIPSTSGANLAPLPPPSIPANDTHAPVAPAANFVAPTQQSSLSATDYLEIAQLVASYGHALDSGYGKGENGEAYAGLYTADASFAGATGHDQLVRLGQIQPRGPDFVRHYLTNHVIEPMPGGAKGKEYLAVIDNGENGRASSLFLGGHYEDTYVKTPQGWRIKTRQLFPPRSGPQNQTVVQTAATPPAASAGSITGKAAAAPANSLSADDTIAIQQLIARSAYALDSAADRGAAWAQLFTADGAFIRKTALPAEIKGRSQLAAFATGDLIHRGPAFVREYLTNYIIQPSRALATGGAATGRVYVVWIEVGENGGAGAIQGGGHYEDEYVRTRGGWRIARRTFVPSRLGPRDVYDVDRTGSVGAPAPRAQETNGVTRPPELTALDYFQIQQLVARYAQYIDTCSNNGYDYADLFTEDGFFAPFQDGKLGPKAQGREALARVSGGGPDGCTGAGWIRQGVHHLYVNHIIDPTPEGAKGQVNMLMIGLGGDKNKIEHDGYYEDTYVKTPAGWKFKSRIHHTTYDPGQK